MRTSAKPTYDLKTNENGSNEKREKENEKKKDNSLTLKTEIQKLKIRRERKKCPKWMPEQSEKYFIYENA